MPIIGIDLGTTNSLCAVWKDGTSRLIPNSFGEYLTPSYVSVDENGEVFVGKIARERAVSHPGATAWAFKRDMGTDKTYSLNGREFTPEELSSLVLRQLREDAEAFLGESVSEAVVSVPAYFNDRQRSATKLAGKLAGLTVERLVNEPSAAALACSVKGGIPEYESLLVVDLGGGTLDVSVVECFENMVSITAVAGDNHVGGNDFDRAIAAYFCQRNGMELDELPDSERAILLREAEICKRQLSECKVVNMAISTERLSGGVILDNPKLIELSTTLLKRIKEALLHALRDAGLGPENTGGIVRVGGSCNMPIVQQYLQHALGIRAVPQEAPELLVALGVGMYAGIKERCGDIKDIILTDICPFTLGTDVYNPSEPDALLMCPVIERNTVLPASRERSFSTVHDFQRQVEINIYQGEEMYAADNLKLGSISAPVPPAPRGEQRIKVRFTYDINGILEVEVQTGAADGKRRALLVNQETGADVQEAERRIAELSKLKLHPREDSENRMLIAEAQRLYAETTGEIRDALQENTNAFIRILSKQNPIRIARGKKQFRAFLEWVTGKPLEANPDMPFQFNDDWSE